MADTLNDLIFGPALDERACGVLPGIDTPELKKPEGQVCIHCIGQGCGVYETRPDVCRSFNCAWKRIASMPPETRPDKLGVMFTLERHLPPRNVFEHLYIAAVAVSDPAALRSRPARDALHMFAEGLLPVFVSWAGTKTLIHPEPAQADAIMNPAPQRDRGLVRLGRAWLKRYAPFARLRGGEQTKLPDSL